MRVLISGGTGFVGPHLCRHFVDEGEHVAVFAPEHSAALPAGTEFFPTDIRDASAVQHVFSDWRPDAVCHLAAISSIASASESLRELLDINVGGTLNVFEAAVRQPSAVRILNVSSSQVYAPSEEPLRECGSVAPSNVYAASKAMAELVAVQFGMVRNAQFVTVRPFNHSGPGQSTNFVLSSFARQIAEIEAGRRAPVMVVGDLDVELDFLDVRDVVRAYRSLLLHGRPRQVYNVGSGTSRSIRSILDEFRSMSVASFELQIDPKRLRPDQPRRVCASIDKLQAETGWRPSIDLSRTLSDLLQYWRAALAPSSAAVV